MIPALAGAGRNIRNVTGRNIYCVVLFFWYNAVKIVSGLLQVKIPYIISVFKYKFLRRRKGDAVLQNYIFFNAVYVMLYGG